MTWLAEQLSRIADDVPERDLAAAALEVHQRRRRTFMALAAATVVVVTVLAGTVGIRALPARPEAAARPSGPPEQSVIRVGVVPSVESAPVYVALANGDFAAEGLTVKPMLITGPAAAVPLLESGALDLVQTDYLTLFQANEAGKKLKIVSGMHQAARGSAAIVVNTQSKINAVRDLKGKRVAVPNLVGLGPLALASALKRDGLTLREDVLMVEKPYPEMLKALHAGQVDAALLAEPFVTMGRETGHIRIVQEVPAGDLAGLHAAGMSATERWIRRNPRTLAAFHRALAKAQRRIGHDPQQARTVLPGYTKVSATVAERVTLGSYPTKLDLRKLQRLADLSRSHKMLRRPVDVTDALVKGR
ncbi:putative extracellular solute-binding protein [[Actinomadura] parvosata subsp. kistnae]|uniref:ABC transporter substrate-binding protein n=1 Tax=[Actinomadura] parvosata TaxID=1955412 RepID=UPI000D28BBBE|nr:putative extracellular solute-binding protein [Actinomadura parvosata subsp. kistnae]